jgi:hypothetical protein
MLSSFQVTMQYDKKIKPLKTMFAFFHETIIEKPFHENLTYFCIENHMNYSRGVLQFYKPDKS